MKSILKFAVWAIIGLIFLTKIAPGFMKGCGSGCNKKATKTFVEGSNRGLYLFSENNDTIYAKTQRGQRLFTYPKGGKTKLETPSGKTYIDVPGVDLLVTPEKPGIYMITPAEQSATGVEIRVE